MGYYRIRAVIIIRAALLATAKNWLAKQGMTGDIFKHEIILKADPDNQPARGYGGILLVDLHGWETLKKAIDGQANCFLFGSMRKKTAVQEGLDFIDSKGYRIKPKG